MVNPDSNIKPKILYVDDESINLRLFKISFKGNYNVTTISSGEQALEIIKDSAQFDIVLSDQRMPGMSGTEFMIKAKKLIPNSKYILLTGYTDIEALEKAINEVGLWQYVKKPWEPSNLKFIIDNAFSSLKTEKENVIISSALQHSEERLNLALTGTNAGVWDWNIKTNEIYFSPTWKEMLGYSKDELEDNIKTLQNLLHPDDLEKSFAHLDEYIQGKTDEYELEYRLQHKNGNYIHILSRGSGLKNQEGEYERITGTNIDLTEKYKAQQQIKELNEELEERVERRTHALKLLNNQLIKRNKFEHLISKISSELIGIKINELDTQLKVALKDIIEFNGSENAFVFSIENSEINIEHENNKLGHKSEIRKVFQKKKTNSFPLILKKLSDNKPYILNDTESLPPEYIGEKKLLNNGDIKSILIIPLTINNNLKGGFGISYTSKIKEWNQEDINLLRFIGEIFMNAFERNNTEQILLKRDKEISEANQIISENERKTNILQNIASIANSPLHIKEALKLSHDIIISQGKGISGLLIKIKKHEFETEFQIENIISNTQQEKTNLTKFFLSTKNELNAILRSTLNSREASIHKNIKLNFNPNTLISYSYDITAIPVIVGNEIIYVYLTLFQPKNSVFNEKGILKDISREISFVAERDKTKKELKKALKKEKELGELKSQFVSMASHQFRTPLTVIQSNIDLFQMLASKIDSDLKGKFDKISNRIQTEVARLGDLMNDVLLLGKLNANVLIADVEINDVIIDIKEVVERLNFIQPDNRKAEIIIEGKKENVLFDKKLFSHAFHNLLENAFKYSRNKPSPKIIVTYSSDIKIQVIDYGKGISEEDLSKLFQPFFRSDSTQNIEGTGLGLVICKRYIELQKGTIEVQSKIDFETKFTILFPLQDEQSINY